MVNFSRNSLNALLQLLNQKLLSKDISVNELSLDSRFLSSGDVFVAVPGDTSDGRTFISHAIDEKVSAIIAEADGWKESFFDVDRALLLNIPIIKVSNIKSKLGLLAHTFYNKASCKKTIIGVTGTNGKTSFCWYVAQLLPLLGTQCAIIGTLGKGVLTHLNELNNTTPDVVCLHRYIAKSSAKYIAMEVSSHGLHQNRVDGIDFDIGVITNISRDHLDYHQTMDAYIEAKLLLFQNARVKTAILNMDSPFIERFHQACDASSTEILTFSTTKTIADVYASNIIYTIQGISCWLETPWGNGELMLPLWGLFNLENVLAVIVCLCHKGFELKTIMLLIEQLKQPPGRMESLGGDGTPIVVIDYAHTPDALFNVLNSLRKHGCRRLTCIFGCGGDRDKGKRSMMMEAVLTYAIKVVVTSDNPRNEDPINIIKDIIENVGCDSSTVPIVIESDRAVAIQETISKASIDDVIVIAGKGHELYQEVKGQKIPFDDKDQALIALSKWRNQ